MTRGRKLQYKETEQVLIQGLHVCWSSVLAAKMNWSCRADMEGLFSGLIIRQDRMMRYRDIGTPTRRSGRLRYCSFCEAITYVLLEH